VTLQARDLNLKLGGREVLRRVSLDLSGGDFTALLGPNGSGKTTLLRVLLGLADPDQGEVLLDGRPLAGQARREIARRMAYVPQAHAPSFPFSVREIVAMGRTPAVGWGGRLSPADHAAVEAALERLGMLAFAERSYAELSGGERQAVLIARALAQDARILLMDEPTASLDLGQQTRLMALFAQLAGEGYGILASAHQPELALRWFNRAILLDRGAVLAQGEPSAVVTGQSLSELYRIDVQVIAGEDGLFLRTSVSDRLHPPPA
jgi:iron complex transport system ATP-binding protein